MANKPTEYDSSPLYQIGEMPALATLYLTAVFWVGYNETMAAPILATKLFIPPPRPNIVPRPRLFEQLNAALLHRLMLISAHAGFGKTTLVSEWLAGVDRPGNQPGGSQVRAAWVSLDEGDNDPVRFLAYLVAAIKTIAAEQGVEALEMLQSPQPPPFERAVCQGATVAEIGCGG